MIYLVSFSNFFPRETASQTRYSWCTCRGECTVLISSGCYLLLMGFLIHIKLSLLLHNLSSATLNYQ